MFIGIITLIWVIKPDVSNYLHSKKIENQNNKNYIEALNYYDEFYEIIKNRSIDKPFSGIESKEIYNSLGCYYTVTNDIKDDKTLADLSCTSIIGNIYERLISFDSEIKREEILQELDKLKNRVNRLMNH